MLIKKWWEYGYIFKLTHRCLIIFFGVNLLIGFLLIGCTEIKSEEEIPAIEPLATLVTRGNRILVSTNDSSKFITNLLGPNYIQFDSRTDFYWFDLTANDLIVEFNEHLLDANWQIESDWGYQNGQILLTSTWTKGDQNLSILLFDDLDSVGIDSLSKNYGISGPIPGSTLCVTHIIVNNSP